MTKRKIARNKRPRASRREITEALIIYVNEVEHGPNDRHWWAEQTGKKVADLQRWIDPSRGLLQYAHDIVAGKYTLDDLPTGRFNEPVDLAALSAKDIDPESRAARAARNLATIGETGVATNGHADPVSDEHVAINRQMDEIKRLRAELKERDKTIEALLEDNDSKDHKTDRLHRYLGMMTETEIERAEKLRRQ